jgi:SET and MYND domain-containing protein 4
MLALVHLASNIIDRATFVACTNDFARISCLLTSPEFLALLYQSSSLLDEQTAHVKSGQTSSEYRDKGNEAYSARNDHLALSFYNQAIRYAPSYSRELSLALGNRSAALYNLKYYHLALEDIHRALDSLSFDDEGNTRRQRLEQRLEQCIRGRSDSSHGSNVDNHEQLRLDLEQLTSQQTFNSQYSSLTSHADIQCSVDRGRHVVSHHVSSTLKPGTIILIEQPYASVLLPSAWSTHCHACFRRLDLVLFPCSQCTRAIYYCLACIRMSIEYRSTG